MDDRLVALVFRSGDGYAVWYDGIPSDDPLLLELIRKYGNDGGTETGSKQDIIEDMMRNI